MSGASKHWRYTHNFMHHKYTNILGMDDDVGYGTLRVTRDQRWKRFNLGNVLLNTILALGFEWGVGLQHLELGKMSKGRDDRGATRVRMREFAAKAGRQVVKDYVAYPALTSVSPAATYRSTLTANAVANVIRNVWSNAVIFCGHFPDGAEKFTKTDMVGESRGQWYLRQMLGSANFDAIPSLAFMSHCATRLSTTSIRTCPATGSPRSRCGCVRSATSTTCLTPPAHSCCSTARRGGPLPSSRCRTSICAIPPTTPRKPAASGCSPNSSPDSPGPTRRPAVAAG